MKHSIEEEGGRKSKVARTDGSVSIFGKDPFKLEGARQWTADELIHRAAEPDEKAYLHVQIFMKFSKNGVLGYNFTLMGESTPLRFDVWFTDALIKHFDLLSFRNQDELLIMLKGAHIKKLAQTSKPKALPVSLSYKEGVVLKIVVSKDATQIGRMIDTWASEFALRLLHVQVDLIITFIMASGYGDSVYHRQ